MQTFREFLHSVENTIHSHQMQASATAHGPIVALARIAWLGYRTHAQTQGTPSADQYLHTLAQGLSLTCTPGEPICRASENEITVLIHAIACEDDLHHRLNNLMRALRNAQLDTRAGISVYPHDAHTAAQLQANAHTALLQARRDSTQRYVIYEAKPHCAH